MLALLMLATGVTVANVYLCQPLLSDVAVAFGVSAGAAAWVATLTQAGYALGILLLVPLGDVADRRRLIFFLLLGETVALCAAASAPSLPVLLIASLAVGMLTPIPQLLITLAVGLGAPARRGRIIGMMQAGLVAGIVGGRALSGLVASLFSWRAAFMLAAAMTLAVAIVLWRRLPAFRGDAEAGYGELLRSLPRLVLSERHLRLACISGFTVGAAFSVFWTASVFLLSGPPFDYGAGTIGALGLLGVVSALAAPLFGRGADRFGPHEAAAASALIAGAGFLVLSGGTELLAFIVVGLVILEIGVQGNQVANQAELLEADSPNMNRLNTVYMVTRFAGMSVGTLAGIAAWESGGWTAVCLTGMAVCTVALLTHARELPSRREERAGVRG